MGGFWLNAVSGVLLLVGYPTKALTNPVFYLKLLLIAVAMVLLVRIGRLVFDGAMPPAPAHRRRLRRLAIASLVCWPAPSPPAGCWPIPTLGSARD